MTGSPHACLHAPAFPRLVRWLSVAWTAALAFMAASLWPQARDAGVRTDALLMLLACAVLIVLGAWWIARSRTSFDGAVIDQTWLWNKRLRVQDVAQLKLVALTGLDWLVAPRLVARTRSPGVVVIHCCERQVLEAFAERWSAHIAELARAPGMAAPAAS